MYEEFKRELIIEPKLKEEEEEEKEGELIKVTDHPLSMETNSTWAQYHSDREIWEEIEKDIKRTRSEIIFFV